MNETPEQDSKKTPTTEDLRKLIYSQRSQSALPFLQQALRKTPEDKELLYLAATAEMSLHRLNYALPYYYELLRLEPTNQAVREQIRNIHRKLVGSWHFAMMNDLPRNEAFDGAIRNAVTKDSVVFEIGTGSGLLSMMAARAGAKEIVTCERLVPAAMAASKIFDKNGFSDHIKLLRKNSQNVQIGSDLSEKADVLIAEILGPAILEEDALAFIADARKRILKESGKVIPRRAKLKAFLVESEELFESVRVGEVSGFDLSPFNALFDEPLVEKELRYVTYKALSSDIDIATVDFTIDHVPLSHKKVSFTVNQPGTCHGVAQWFRLYTDEAHYMDTSPKGAKSSHWRQVIQVFDRPLTVEAGDTLIFDVVERKNRYSFTSARHISTKDS